MNTPPNLYDILSELNYIDPDTIHTYNQHIIDLYNINTSIDQSLQTIDPPQINILPDFTRDNNGNTINRYPYTLKEFNKFLIKTHCEENLEFFIMTKRFLLYIDKKSNRANSVVSYVPSTIYSDFDLQLWDEQIYNVFIKVDSPKECNLPQYIRGLFDDCHRQEIPPKQIYIIQAIQHILGLLLDAYTRFIQYVQQFEPEEWERRKMLLENAVETTTTTTTTTLSNPATTFSTTVDNTNKDSIDTTLGASYKNINNSINRKKVDSTITTTLNATSSSSSTILKKRRSMLIPTRKDSSQHSNTSILLKSKKFFNKIKKTIQI